MASTVRDNRRVVGSRISAKAIHVTSHAECARRYGSNSKAKEVFGTVVEVLNSKTTNNRVSTMIKADFEFEGGVIKSATLNIRSIKSVIQTNPAVPTIIAAAADASPAEAEVTTANTLFGATSVNREEPATEAATTLVQEVETRATRAEASGNDPAVVCHGTNWYDDEGRTKESVYGPVSQREWFVRTPVGDIIGPGSDKTFGRSRLDYFLLMFPRQQLQLMHRLINEELTKISSQKEMTKGELLQFFGVLILITKFEFGKRSSLWSTTARSKYIPAPALGRTGMSRQRFDILFRCLRFGKQSETRPPGMSSERHRWLLVDDFISNINDHRAANFVPSERLCADESISRWYGLGGSWINMGLPQYVAIDRKPENGCEIQNLACGVSGVMLCLKLVKTSLAEEEGREAIEEEDENTEFNHGTKILKMLVQPWIRSDRIVCADSYFASVATAEEMKRLGLRFIGVVKTATRRFPLRWLSTVELVNRGDRKGLVAKDADGNTVMLAFVWMDRDRRYFITNTSSLSEGRPYVRNRWRQVNQERDAEPEMVDLVVPQPQACEIYYTTCATIDQHNRHRQDTLMLEHKIETKNWSARVGTTLFGMMVVDTWLVYKGATDTQESQQDFYTLLSEELIDNTYEQVGGVSGARRTCQTATISDLDLVNKKTGAGRAGIAVHLTPTKKKRKRKDGTLTNHSLQGRCRICGLKTRYMCSMCDDERNDDDGPSSIMWLCHSETYRMCFSEHISDEHT